MTDTARSRFPFAKIATFFAVAFCIGVGLCGLDYFLAAHNIGKSHEEFGVGPLDGLSLLVMLLSALGLVIAVIAWVIAAIFGFTSLSRSDTDPQTLFHSSDDSSDTDNHDSR